MHLSSLLYGKIILFDIVSHHFGDIFNSFTQFSLIYYFQRSFLYQIVYNCKPSSTLWCRLKRGYYMFFQMHQECIKSKLLIVKFFQLCQHFYFSATSFRSYHRQTYQVSDCVNSRHSQVQPVVSIVIIIFSFLHMTKSMCIAVQLSKFFSTIVNFIMSAF